MLGTCKMGFLLAMPITVLCNDVPTTCICLHTDWFERKLQNVICFMPHGIRVKSAILFRQDGTLLSLP